MPFWQALSEQAPPAVHALQAPLLHTPEPPKPQVVPLGMFMPATHTWVPVEQE